jgi:hypothetical protein
MLHTCLLQENLEDLAPTPSVRQRLHSHFANVCRRPGVRRTPRLHRSAYRRRASPAHRCLLALGAVLTDPIIGIGRYLESLCRHSQNLRPGDRVKATGTEAILSAGEAIASVPSLTAASAKLANVHPQPSHDNAVIRGLEIYRPDAWRIHQYSLEHSLAI